MAIQLINVGQIANDGTGDDLREAMIKINQNFEELDLRDDEQTTATNLGEAGEGIFAQRVNYDLQFKKLIPGTGVTLTPTEQSITIDTINGLQQLIVSSDNGSIILADGDSINIVGGQGVETSVIGNNLTITNTKSSIVTDTTPQLGGNLDGQNFDIAAVNNLQAVSISGLLSGDVEGNVYGIDVRDLKSEVDSLYTWDFGDLAQNVGSILEWLFLITEVDFGTVNDPTNVTVDFGSL